MPVWGKCELSGVLGHVVVSMLAASPSCEHAYRLAVRL